MKVELIDRDIAMRGKFLIQEQELKETKVSAFSAIDVAVGGGSFVDKDQENSGVEGPSREHFSASVAVTDSNEDNYELKEASRQMKKMDNTYNNVRTSRDKERYNLSNEPLVLPRIELSNSIRSSQKSNLPKDSGID